jgi:PAS domain S-box-containing protein
MLGYGAESIRGGNVAELFDPADLPALRADMQRLFDGRLQVLRRKVSVRRRDKTTLTVRVACVALRSGAGRSGRVDRYVAVVEDLSDELRLQRAEAANRAKSEFVSRMGHELRTPLNAMLGFAQLLSQPQAQPLSEHHRAWAEQIQRAGWHLLDLVNDTLDLARIEAGNLRVQLEAVELAPLVKSCVDLVAAAARPHGITITVELASLLPRVQADPTRLRQVLTNLLSNAVKYNREHGEVHLRARTDEGERVRLTVTDTGLGMTAAQMQHLFEPYNRLGREGSGVEGTGIGLTIARRLAELMGGELTAESTSGSGSTFSLTLRAAAGPPPEPLAADALSAPAYHQRTVLYIEDNPANVEVLRGMLLARPQVRLEVATLGLDGIEAVRRLRPDLILLDMQLPDINGLELLRHLMAGSPRIPVVVISADASAQRHDQALALGARDYVTKPLALGSFLQLLDEVLQETPTQQGSAELLL